jgi:dTDP-4-dehydrorhamnose reductase
MTRVLITGAAGQLGKALVRSAPGAVELISVARSALDISDEAQVHQFVRECRPNGIINAAAYTAVDKAEEEQVLAHAINAVGPRNLAAAARAVDAHLVHVSTDFVFDGSKGAPYLTTDAVCPVSVYGRTKAEGEEAVLSIPDTNATVLRTAWVYSATGGNFLTTMLRLMGERESLNVVADQIGTPTSADGLARACWGAFEKRLGGIHHWTDAGAASWYDFAVAIEAAGRAAGVLPRQVAVTPIPSSQFPTPAQRPSNSLLDKFETWQALDQSPPHWTEALTKVIAEVKSNLS